MLQGVDLGGRDAGLSRSLDGGKKKPKNALLFAKSNESLQATQVTPFQLKAGRCSIVWTQNAASFFSTGLVPEL